MVALTMSTVTVTKGIIINTNSLFNAVVAQSVEHQLPKLRVAGSSPVYRSNKSKNNSLCNKIKKKPST